MNWRVKAQFVERIPPEFSANHHTGSHLINVPIMRKADFDRVFPQAGRTLVSVFLMALAAGVPPNRATHPVWMALLGIPKKEAEFFPSAKVIPPASLIA
jgi:hypothetical protein